MTIAGVTLSHPERVLHAGQGLTKRDLAEYEAAVAGRLLPHVAGRPLGLLRCPAGRRTHCFFQRHAGAGVPEAVRRVDAAAAGGTAPWLAIDDLPGLIALVQIGALELHPWGARFDDLERPDRLILDFDPDEGLPFAWVKAAAAEARDRLVAFGLESFLKTTGGKGLHVTVPLAPRLGWAEARAFAGGLAAAMAQDTPGRYVTTPAKRARRGRIFIDTLRNERAGSAIAPYSARARDHAPVATPLGWDELDGLSGGDAFTVATVPQRLAAQREDPWAGMEGLRQTIPERAFRALGLAS